MRVEATSAPADSDLLVPLDEVKRHLAVTIDDDDGLITGLIEAVAECLDGPDGRLARSLRGWSYRLRIDCFPVMAWRSRYTDTYREVYAYASPRRVETDPRIRLPYGPVKSVSSVRWTDGDGEETTLDAERYSLRDIADLSYLYPEGEGWPEGEVEEVVIEYRALTGTVADDGAETVRVPRPVRVAAMMMVQGLYDHRDATPMRKDMPMESPQIMDLLRPYMLTASMSADDNYP